ncbi:acyltransferase [Deferribacterales bacterium RsTz2092]
MLYRADIDGLRAFAVIPIILFHLGFTKFFGGGYAGVDIFYVISGFLITSIIYGEMTGNVQKSNTVMTGGGQRSLASSEATSPLTGEEYFLPCASGTRKSGEGFSFLKFYERRVRRIIPPLVFMTFLSILLVTYCFSPVFLSDFFNSVKYIFLFAGNIYFWRDGFNYFRTDIATKPLLHTWSLGVEEQFYILFPLVLFLLVRYANKHTLKALIVLWITSFALNIHFIFQDTQLVFYWLPFRAWELLTGAILAVSFPHSSLRTSTNAGRLGLGGSMAGVVGLLLICTGIVLLGYTRKAHFPGFLALMPVIGTFLCISAGGNGIAGRILSWKPFVHIGKLSYAMYLWHWVLIVCWKQLFSHTLDVKGVCMLIILTYLLSAFSYKFIEQPVRRRKVLAERKKLFSVAAMICFGFVLMSIPAKHWSDRMLNLIVSPYASSYEQVNDYCERAVLLGIQRGGKTDVWSVKDDNKSVVLVLGDSYALQLSALLDSLSGEYNRKYMLIGCISYMLTSKLCEDKFIESLTDKRVSDVLVAISFGSDANWESWLKERIKLVESYNPKARLWMQIPAPSMPFHTIDNSYLGKDTAITRQKYDEKEGVYVAKIRNIGTHIVDVPSRMCDDNYCYGVIESTIMYSDAGHLTVAGIFKLRDLYEPIFKR